jgi:thiol-disulfide isomerase/thioredoxin
MGFRRTWTASLSIFLLVVGLGTNAAFADIIDDVRTALSQNAFTYAESQLSRYKTQHGVDPEYLEALSWMGRAALANQQYDKALSYAKETRTLAIAQLKAHKLDSEEHLPTALGAAYEVEAQAMTAQGQKTQAVALLHSAIRTYGDTSIRPRLQKNLNILTFVGQPAPPLQQADFLGDPPPPLANMKGSPVLLFFWAHWCADCKGEAPVLARLRSEFGSQGLLFLAPTQRYGYAARGEDATPKQEKGYIDSVWRQFYSGLQGVSVPVSKTNFDVYGASTTPTLVLVDRTGKIALYHPGALPYNELRLAIEKVIR